MSKTNRRNTEKGSRCCKAIGNTFSQKSQLPCTHFFLKLKFLFYVIVIIFLCYRYHLFYVIVISERQTPDRTRIPSGPRHSAQQPAADPLQ